MYKGKYILTVFGEQRSLSEMSKMQVCKDLNLSRQDLYNRIVVGGWKPEKAATTPIRK